MMDTQVLIVIRHHAVFFNKKRMSMTIDMRQSEYFRHCLSLHRQRPINQRQKCEVKMCEFIADCANICLNFSVTTAFIDWKSFCHKFLPLFVTDIISKCSTQFNGYK